MNFSQIILESRKKLNMTQRIMAEKLNVSDKTISKWETGVNFPDLKMLNQISLLIGVSVADLLEADDLKVPEIDTKTETTLMTRFRTQQVVAYLLFVFALINIILGLKIAYWISIIGLLLFTMSIILFSYSMISFKSTYDNKRNIQTFDRLSNFYSMLFFESIFFALFIGCIQLNPTDIVGQLILISFQVVPMLFRKHILKSNNYEVKKDKMNIFMTRAYWSIVALGNLLYGLLMTGWIQTENQVIIATLVFMIYLFLFGSPILGFAIYQRKQYK